MQPEPIFEEQTEDRDKAITILENNLKRSLDFRKKVNDYKSLSFSLSPLSLSSRASANLFYLRDNI